MSLAPPPKRFSRLELPTVTVSAESLFRVSRHRAGEPHFGRSGGSRFDDPRYRRNRSRRFGTCYFGLSFDVAFAETVLHDEVPVDGYFEISLNAVESRLVVQFEGSPLTLADLTGAGLKSLGADGSLSTETPYRTPQLWSVAVHEHPSAVDGFRYVSRHLNTGMAVVLYDRAGTKLRARTYTPLVDFPGALSAVFKFKIKPV